MQFPAPKARDLRPPRWSGIVAVAAVLVVILAVTFDWNWFRGPVERRVSTLAGRDFVIHGDLHVDLGRVITVTAERPTLSNVDWSRQSEFARADRVRVDIALWPLLRGAWVLPRIELDRPRLFFERNRAGDANWRFGREERPRRRNGRPLYVGELIVHDGALQLHDVLRRTNLRLGVDSTQAGRPATSSSLVARGTGRHRDGDLEFVGRVDSPPGTFANGGQHRIDVRARAGRTRAHVSGHLPVPVDVRSWQLHAEISGDNLADLYPLLGIAVPETPPYVLIGELSRAGNVARFRDFTGTVGDSDLSGDISINFGGKRPSADARLVSERLDFDDLAGLVGAPPGTEPGETASPDQKAEARRRAARQRVLPDRPYDLEKLRSMDATVTFRAAAVDAGRLPINSMAVQLWLEGGRLRIKPFDLGIAGGRLTGGIRLDATGDPIAIAVDLRARQVELPRLFPRTVPDSLGLIAGDIRLEGRGNSVAGMFATARGDVGVAMGRGRFSNLLLELAGLDVAESLRFLLGDDRTVPLRCAYADFDVDDGIMTAEAFAFDTTDTVVFGAGTLNLRKETLDLELEPKPKDLSPVSLRVPLEIGGTFKDPSVAPRWGPLAARTATAAALYVVAPPAALLALIETGPGEDVECGGQPHRMEDERLKAPATPARERRRWKAPA